MQQFIAWVDKLDWGIIVVACLTLGLAPFAQPRIVEKLQMLAKGKLVRPIDWFDLLFHGAPWILLLIKTGLTLKSLVFDELPLDPERRTHNSSIESPSPSPLIGKHSGPWILDL